MTRPTEADMQAGMPGQVRGLYPPVPRWTLDHGRLILDGEPVGLGLGRTHWGDEAPTAAALDDLERHILALLNRDAESYGDVAPDAPCTCGHWYARHQSGEGAWSGFCDGTLGDLGPEYLYPGADPSEPCECESFVAEGNETDPTPAYEPDRSVIPPYDDERTGA